MWCMPPGPVPADPGREEDPVRRSAEPAGPAEGAAAAWEPVITRPDPMTEEDRQAWLDSLTGDDEPDDEEEYPGEDDLEEIIAECRQISAEQARDDAQA